MSESCLTFRSARSTDSSDIAELHADSWRRHYRGAYSDSFLDGDIVEERRAVWFERLEAPQGSATILATDRLDLIGFVHVVFDQDPTWGSLVDNLHVVDDRRRGGIGSQLMIHAANAVTGGAADGRMFLWVLEQNTAAQSFYAALGATSVEITPVSPPGGIPTRLNGSPNMLRMVWPDASSITNVTTERNASQLTLRHPEMTSRTLN